jgi:hypothetical protein
VPLLPTPNTERIQEQEDPVVDIAADRVGELTEVEATGRMMRRRDGTLFPGTVTRQYSTVELLVTEQRTIEQAIAGIGAGRWTAPERLVEAWLRRHPHLTEGQREMVRRFATSGNSLDIGIGPAGTGKTAVMEVIGQLAALTGTPILGAALAGRTAAGLETATGIPSSTLTRLVGHAGDQADLPHRAIVVVDEAGMVGTRQLAAIANLVEAAEGKLILIGDDRQLPEIDAGGLFKALARRLPAVELTDNIRQQHEWERTALTELRDGSVDRAIEAYRQAGRVLIGPSRDDTIASAVDDWYRHVTAAGDLTSGLLIAYDNDTVTELNETARTHLTASNRLHGPTLEVGERVFQTGDPVLCRQNQGRLGVLNGDLATVIAVDQERKRLTVRLDRDPETRNLPAWYLDRDVDYGYAMTGHKAQGVTADRTFVVVDGTTDRQWAYVAMSRGRQTNTLYLTNPQHAEEQCTHLTHHGHRDALDTLVAALNRASTQTAAIDHTGLAPTGDIDPYGPPPPSRDIAARAAWQIAKRQTERAEAERQTPGPDRAVGR